MENTKIAKLIDAFRANGSTDENFLLDIPRIISSMPEKTRLRISKLMSQILPAAEYWAALERVNAGIDKPNDSFSIASHSEAFREIGVAIGQCLLKEKSK